MSYIESKNIKVYPSAYRGKFTTNSGELVFNPDSRLSIEENLIRSYTEISSQHYNKPKGSFVITTNYDASTAADSDAFEFVLKGYYFKIQNVKQYVNNLTKGYYVQIMVSPKGAQVDPDNTSYTAYSLSPVDGSSADILDQQTGSKYEFLGLDLTSQNRIDWTGCENWSVVETESAAIALVTILVNEAGMSQSDAEDLVDTTWVDWDTGYDVEKLQEIYNAELDRYESSVNLFCILECGKVPTRSTIKFDIQDIDGTGTGEPLNKKLYTDIIKANKINVDTYLNSSIGEFGANKGFENAYITNINSTTLNSTTINNSGLIMTGEIRSDSILPETAASNLAAGDIGASNRKFSNLYVATANVDTLTAITKVNANNLFAYNVLPQSSSSLCVVGSDAQPFDKGTILDLHADKVVPNTSAGSELGNSSKPFANGTINTINSTNITNSDTLTTTHILPTANQTTNIGAAGTKFNSVYANVLDGSLQVINGTSGAAACPQSDNTDGTDAYKIVIVTESVWNTISTANPSQVKEGYLYYVVQN